MFGTSFLLPLQKVYDDGEDDSFNVRRLARGAGERVRRREGGVVPDELALATSAELYGIVVGDVAVPPKVEARHLGVVLRRAVLRKHDAQPVLTRILHQHQTLLDQVLTINDDKRFRYLYLKKIIRLFLVGRVEMK